MKGEQVDIQTNDGYSPLHIATEAGRTDCVELLLGYGANVHLTTTTMGENPLHIASRVANGKVSADLLLKSGVNVNSTTDEVSNHRPEINHIFFIAIISKSLF